jgi:hypothetical protein
MGTIQNRGLRLALAWALAGELAAAQEEPPRLELPKPAPAAIPPPNLNYKAPAGPKWDTGLLYSQMALAGTGTGATAAAQVRRYYDDSKVPAFTSVGVVGLTLVLERAYDPHMSNRTKKWVMIANFVASGVLSGLLARDVGGARSTLQTGVPPK